ncbi:hypothetical protein FVE85_6371 [Porphyridium purpureum]|uniref:Uncharacterized protein n=1 Tax=Porphyridium purpureum TaxID=35688 RepID=A0A5J4Z524_PORPP|nr:hypothetical protein FVE85_6371 [Porphyridium purpureum]|eukprot:POR1957..scf295_1
MVRMHMIALALCAVVAASAAMVSAQTVGLVYAVEQRVNDKSFFTINSTAADPSLTLLANMSVLETTQVTQFPFNCYGYTNGIVPVVGQFNLFAPNAAAYDGQARLFFASWDTFGDTMTRLCLVNLVSNSIQFVTTLPETEISGAGFDQTLYMYAYIREGRQQPNGILVGQLTYLDRATANFLFRTTVDQHRNVTTDPMNPQNFPLGPLSFTYRAGDLAIACDRVLYASSVGTGGGFKYFFKLFQSGPPPDFSYELIHADPPGVGLTGFATADQLAFGGEDNLISQDSALGIFSLVNLETGANGELGVEGVDYVRFFFEGILRTFTDLASTLDCGVDLDCIALEVESSCVPGEMIVQYIPDPDGTIPCAPIETVCLAPPACTEEFECSYYIPTNQGSPGNPPFGL